MPLAPVISSWFNRKVHFDIVADTPVTDFRLHIMIRKYLIEVGCRHTELLQQLQRPQHTTQDIVYVTGTCHLLGLVA